MRALIVKNARQRFIARSVRTWGLSLVIVASVACNESSQATASAPSQGPLNTELGDAFDAFRAEWHGYAVYFRANITSYRADLSATWRQNADGMREIGNEATTRIDRLAALQSQLRPLVEDAIRQGRVPVENAKDLRALVDTYGEWIENQRQQIDDLLGCIDLRLNAAIRCLEKSNATASEEVGALYQRILQLQGRLSDLTVWTSLDI